MRVNKKFLLFFKSPKLFSLTITITMLLIAIGAFVYPFIPKIQLFLKQKNNPEQLTQEYYSEKYGLLNQNTPEVLGDSEFMRLKVADNKSNRLIIPKIGVEIDITMHKSQSEALEDGAWMIPGSALPGENGQLIISGHRFEIVPPAKNTFYNLDQLNNGDTYMIIYDGYAYQYEVTGDEIIKPDDFTFEGAGSENNEVILYTCTPLWTAANRLLVYSKQIPFTL